MQVRIDVYTPKNQAAKCVKSHRLHIAGLRYNNRILEEKVDTPESFHYIMDIQAEQLHDLTERLFKYEYKMRKGYLQLMHLIIRVNSLMKKFDKGCEWARRWMMKHLKKVNPNPEENTILKDLEEMDTSQVREFLNVTDIEYMRSFLEGKLIDYTVLSSEIPSSEHHTDQLHPSATGDNTSTTARSYH
jgi:hypothetical protein